MGLMDVLHGMANGPHGPAEPGRRGGISPITMGLLALLAYKTMRGEGPLGGLFRQGSAPAGNAPAGTPPSAPAQVRPGRQPSGLAAKRIGWSGRRRSRRRHRQRRAHRAAQTVGAEWPRRRRPFLGRHRPEPAGHAGQPGESRRRRHARCASAGDGHAPRRIAPAPHRRVAARRRTN